MSLSPFAQAFERIRESLSSDRAISRGSAASEDVGAADEAFAVLERAMKDAARLGPADESLKAALDDAQDSSGLRIAVGGLYLDQGRLQEAETHLREAARLDQASEPARLLLGKALAGLGRGEEAVNAFEEALAVAPGSTAGRIALAEIYIAQCRWEEAEAPLRECLRLRDGLLKARLLLGSVFEARGMLGDAEDCYLSAVRSHPKESEPRRRLGEFYFGQRRYEEAEGELEAVSPSVPEAAFKLGWIYQQSGRTAAMRSCFKDYLKAETPLNRSHRFLAATALGDYEIAIAEGESALDEKGGAFSDRFFHPWADDWFPPRKNKFYEDRLKEVEGLRDRRDLAPWPRYFKGLLLSRLGRTKESLVELDAVGTGRYSWMRYASGWGRMSLEMHDRALEDFEAAFRSQPGLWLARCHRGEVFLCLGDMTRAFAAFVEAERDADGKTLAHIRAWRGELLLWLGMYEEAVRELDRAVRGGSRFAVTWRGAAYMLTEDWDRAEKDLDRAAAGGTQDAEIFLWRGELHRRRGEHEKALIDLDRCVEYGDETWALVNRALTYGSMGREDDMRRDFEALPECVIDAPRGLGSKDVVKILEKALADARGIRRPERYVNSLWRRSRA